MTQDALPWLSTPALPRFLADRMVGRLATWLRILGYDTAYLPHLSPQGLLREGRRQGRILLTRDSRLLRQKDVPSLIFIRDDHFRGQLKQVIVECRLTPMASLFARCSECNQVLEAVAKETIQDQVPEYVWQTQGTFHRCPECHRIYWSATHKVHALAELRRLGIEV
ncbi:MAG: hypothetical protein EXR78_08620 [Deltaproteobacteria bacterium]|nr:hypothetical protein [Deltaproteobacteria bacterium]